MGKLDIYTFLYGPGRFTMSISHFLSGLLVYCLTQCLILRLKYKELFGEFPLLMTLSPLVWIPLGLYLVAQGIQDLFNSFVHLITSRKT